MNRNVMSATRAEGSTSDEAQPTERVSSEGSN